MMDMDDHTALAQEQTVEPSIDVVTIPRNLVNQTMQLLLSVPASQVYLLIKDWDDAVPGLIQPISREEAR